MARIMSIMKTESCPIDGYALKVNSLRNKPLLFGRRGGYFFLSAYVRIVKTSPMMALISIAKAIISV